MKGDDTRFLTGTDEHSVNIAQRAAELGKDTKAFVDEMVGLFTDAEAQLLIAPDRFIRTTDPDHRRASQEMVRRAYANGDVYLGKYEGWYCPNEGFKAPSDLLETPDGMRCPNHPERPAPVADRAQLVLPPVGVPATGCSRTTRRNPDWVQPEYRKNEMLAFIRAGPRGHLDQPRDLPLGHPVPDRRERRDRGARGRLVGPRGGRHLRLVRRAHQLHHRRGLSG